ncbi:hypothetical protein AKJ65_03575 [candidate division MSBL1 archaeon SCGC-AAA259E19]|uniref:Uncharacterized protein n=1 Tax=candidate division MSBL1 archaeon SCGC-AAA259E19 TaxID=1698264 RepID=A0A133UKI4_9EURY|nr:hypothetical protein AKJ65_03575 [candidate division MSBL1 archaeon SCGC-AAA259E19]
MEDCRDHEILAVPHFHPPMIWGGGELNLPTADDTSDLLEQHEVSLSVSVNGQRSESLPP